MSLPVQSLRTVLATLAACLIFATSATISSGQDAPKKEKPQGSDIRGVVTYADTGRPLRYAAISLVLNDGGVFQAGDVTNGRGEFVFPQRSAGRYLIFVDSPAILRPGSYPRNMGPLTSQIRLNEIRDLFTEVVVNGTDPVDVKIQAIRGGVITGRVVAEDDQPVADAQVKLLRRENGKWLPVEFTWQGGRYARGPKTDPSGVYRIAGLATGEYIVRISETAIASERRGDGEEAYSDGSQMVVYYPSATTIREAQAVSVNEGSESTGVDIRMPDRIPRTLSGTVTIGPDDQTAGWAEIVVERADETGFAPGYDATTRTDEEGKWEVRGMPAGEYLITFRGSVRLGTGDSAGYVQAAPKQVSVSIGHEDVVLNQRMAVGAGIMGRLKFDGATPKEMYGWSPGVVADKGSERSPKNQRVIPSRDPFPGSFTGYFRDQGKFHIYGLPEGKYSFVMSGFEPGEYYVKSVTRKGADISQKSFKLEAGMVIEDVLVTMGTDVATIEGQLSESKTKMSPGEVVLLLAAANESTRRFSPGLRTLHPDAKGKFVFSCGPGEYFIAAFTREEIAKLKTPITPEYFFEEKPKFVRVKVRAGEKLKDVKVPLGP